MKHPNTLILEKLYSDFSQGNLQGVLDACSDSITFQVPGKSQLAGKYTKNNFIQDFALKLKELSEGTFQLEVHDILASDLHAAVLATNRLKRGGKTVELRTVHIWRFEGTKPLAWYEYPRDLYQFDAIWA
jgi:ketosteroid isomerase-like protein